MWRKGVKSSGGSHRIVGKISRYSFVVVLLCVLSMLRGMGGLLLEAFILLLVKINKCFLCYKICDCSWSTFSYLVLVCDTWLSWKVRKCVTVWCWSTEAWLTIEQIFYCTSVVFCYIYTLLLFVIKWRGYLQVSGAFELPSGRHKTVWQLVRCKVLSNGVALKCGDTSRVYFIDIVGI